MSIPQIFQIIGGVGLIVSAVLIIRHVLKTTISDKYGVMSLVFLGILFYINMSHNWFAMGTIGTGILALAAEAGFIALGISFSIQLTDYSKARRKAVQDLALLRFRYLAAVKKFEASDAVQTANAD